MSSIMFAAPTNDLRNALANGRMGFLNPFPWAMMTGNTIGWIAYGYFIRDPFLVASNLPGFILSIWLNMGAAKLQYLEIKELQKSCIVDRNQVMQRWDADRVPEDGSGNQTSNNTRVGGGNVSGLISRRRTQQQDSEGVNLLVEEPGYLQEESVEITPHETVFLRVLVAWAVILVYTSWLYPRNGNPAGLIGVIVNLNLIVFYGAPLKTIKKVVSEKNSASIHKETMIMNWINTTFWIGYGCARRDLVVIVPNATGLMLGIAQGTLCLLYPRNEEASPRPSLQDMESDLLNPEEAVPVDTTPSPVEDGDNNKSSQANDPPEVV